jgi:hypothetical protein
MSLPSKISHCKTPMDTVLTADNLASLVLLAVLYHLFRGHTNISLGRRKLWIRVSSFEYIVPERTKVRNTKLRCVTVNGSCWEVTVQDKQISSLWSLAMQGVEEVRTVSLSP